MIAFVAVVFLLWLEKGIIMVGERYYNSLQIVRERVTSGQRCFAFEDAISSQTLHRLSRLRRLKFTDFTIEKFHLLANSQAFPIVNQAETLSSLCCELYVDPPPCNTPHKSMIKDGCRRSGPQAQGTAARMALPC